MSQAYYGIDEIQYQYRGQWASPTIEFNGREYYLEDLEDSLESDFIEDVESGELNITKKDLEADFDKYFIQWKENNKDLILCEMEEIEASYGFTPNVIKAEEELSNIIDAGEYSNFSNRFDSLEDIDQFDLIVKHGLIDEQGNVLNRIQEDVAGNGQLYEVMLPKGDYKIVCAPASDVIDDIYKLENLNERYLNYLNKPRLNKDIKNDFIEYLDTKLPNGRIEFNSLDSSKRNDIVGDYLNANTDKLFRFLARNNIYLDEDLTLHNNECFQIIEDVATERLYNLRKLHNVEYRESYINNLKQNKTNNVPNKSCKEQVKDTLQPNQNKKNVKQTSKER